MPSAWSCSSRRRAGPSPGTPGPPTHARIFRSGSCPGASPDRILSGKDDPGPAPQGVLVDRRLGYAPWLMTPARFVLAAALFAAAPAAADERLRLDADWRFHKGDLAGEGAAVDEAG